MLPGLSRASYEDTDPTEQAIAAADEALGIFTRDELSLLMSIEATMAADRYLVPLGQACSDHQACRRLAFGLWLRLTHRVGEGIDDLRASPSFIGS